MIFVIPLTIRVMVLKNTDTFSRYYGAMAAELYSVLSCPGMEDGGVQNVVNSFFLGIPAKCLAQQRPRKSLV